MIELTEDQRAVLQEMTNIGMGQAGDSISRVWDEFVELSIPSIALVEAKSLPARLATLVPGTIAAARQAFHGGFWGEAITVMPTTGRHQLSILMGRGETVSPTEQREIFLDMANILGGACVTGLAQQLDIDVGFTAPSLIGDALLPTQVLNTEEMAVKTALSLEVNFAVETRSLALHLIILFPEEEFARLTGLLDVFLAAL